MYQSFGATVNQTTVTFNLFLPDNAVDPAQYTRGGSPKIKAICVRGDFQSELGGVDWGLADAPAMIRQPHSHGWLWSCTLPADLPEGFYQYKYFVTFENDTDRWVTDPCTKYGGSDNDENSAFVVGGHSVPARPIVQRLPPQDLVLYELMIDDFTAAYRGDRAPIDAIHDKLDYLQALGINAVEFMPWMAWPGSDFSWGYDPFQFFAVEYRYVHDDAQPADKLFRLKTLINALHDRGIHVIMDGVFNHVRAGINPNKGFPYLWLYQNPEESPFIGQFERGGFFEEFDYDNLCTQQFIRDVCLYWLDAYQLDGIRFDFTIGFYREGDARAGISRLIGDIKTQLTAQNRENVALIVEHLTDNRYEAIDDANQMDADGCWFDPFMYEHFDMLNAGRITPQILRILNANLDFDTGKTAVTYIENHDHSTVISEAGGRQRWYKSQPAAIALLTSPGLVMIHNGQEFGEDYWLPHEGAERVKERPLRWDSYANDFIGQRLFTLYQNLIRIRRDYPALRSSNYFPSSNHPDGYGIVNDSVVVFHRYGEGENGNLQRFIIAINYADGDQHITIPFPTNGLWRDLLNEETAVVANYRLFHQCISSNWGRFYFQST
ncbi:MAG: 1,4-alpha-glucan branching enzyme [Chloroflexi bacterium]|nr:1,4-alpha-glucan branching enzyme [Chloroflexota bacterium]